MDTNSIPLDIQNLLFFISHNGYLAAFMVYCTCKAWRKIIGAKLKSLRITRTWLIDKLKNDAAKCGNWNVVKWLIVDMRVSVNSKMIKHAIQQGNQNILALPQMKIEAWQQTECICTAIKANRPSMIEYLIYNKSFKGNTHKIIETISQVNDFGLFQWFLKVAIKWYNIYNTYGSNTYGSTKSKLISTCNSDMDMEILRSVICGGSFSIFTWVLDKILVTHISYDDYKITVKHGHLEILKYIIDRKYCEFSKDTIQIAIKWGHVHILEWIHSKGYPINAQSSYEIAMNHGQLKVFMKLVDLGYEIPQDILSHVDSDDSEPNNISSQLAIAECLLSTGFQPDMKLCRILINKDRLDLLKITLDKSFYRTNAQSLALESIHKSCFIQEDMSIVKWFIEEFRGEINLTKLCESAIISRNIKIVQWLILEKEATISYEFLTEHSVTDLEIIKLLHIHGKVNLKSILFSDVHQFIHGMHS